MSQARRVVIVEDDPEIRSLLEFALQRDGFEVTTCAEGREAIAVVREQRPDLVTLDLSLPDMDGTEVCRELRTFTDVYIMMITGRSEEVDRLVGLEVGADDYLSKPFSAREVRARVAALLRRPRASAPASGGATVDAGGGLMLVPVAHVAILDGQPLPLTPVEVELLTVLAAEPGRLWARADLVRTVWKGDFIESDFLVDLNVASIRRKLRKAGNSDHEWIRTVDGSGYAFDPA
ncbi:response regulator transcription factor [Nocardioides fonticola]|uniref:Response regulator transcription factor n=1 Tax=Nocardioides fonticola TaxID=450363 RepID=A0ABP7XHK2_9ACTN